MAQQAKTPWVSWRYLPVLPYNCLTSSWSLIVAFILAAALLVDALYLWVCITF